MKHHRGLTRSADSNHLDLRDKPAKGAMKEFLDYRVSH